MSEVKRPKRYPQFNWGDTLSLIKSIAHWMQQANSYMDHLEAEIEIYAKATDEKDDEISSLESENRELRDDARLSEQALGEHANRLTEAERLLRKVCSGDAFDYVPMSLQEEVDAFLNQKEESEAEARRIEGEQVGGGGEPRL